MDSNLTLYENLFEIQIVICERFHMSPFDLRRERFKDFILLVERLSNHNLIEKRNYRKVKMPDGSYQYVKKVYADDNDSI